MLRHLTVLHARGCLCISLLLSDFKKLYHKMHALYSNTKYDSLRCFFIFIYLD